MLKKKVKERLCLGDTSYSRRCSPSASPTASRQFWNLVHAYLTLSLGRVSNLFLNARFLASVAGTAVGAFLHHDPTQIIHGITMGELGG